MPWEYLSPVLGGIISMLGTNRANRLAQESANRTNIALTERQNQLAKQESELAYQRSSPSNQVNRMIIAGMSRAGAINAINGAGNYTPAPVSTAQVEAPSIEGLDGSLLTSVAQIMSAERMQAKELKLERDKFEYDKKRNAQNDAYDNIIKTFQAAKINSEAQSANLDWLVKEFTHNERIDAEKQRLIAEKAKSLSDELQSKLYKGALEDVDSETLKSLFKYQAVLEMLGNIGHMTTEKAIQIIHDVKEILIPG